MISDESALELESEIVAKPTQAVVPEDDALLVMAIAEGTDLRDELYSRYRRPLLQVFLQRRVDRDAAQDLLQLTFLQAIKKIRLEGLDDPSNLGGYLYRTATRLATAYWRGDLSARESGADELQLREVKDEALSIEERVDNQILSKCIRDLMKHLSAARDREVLLRFYLNEEPKQAICSTLGLTDLQFNQVLWRARQRFGEILRRHGVASSARCPMVVVALAFALLGASEGKLLVPDDGNGAVELHSEVSFEA
jgi:RNA polymerase sigma factor (sigma-70 family)